MSKWKKRFRDLTIFVLGIIFASCSIVLAETCQTTLSSANITYDNTTAEAAVNSLFTQAGNIDSRLNGYFQNNATSFFDGNDLRIAYNNTTSGISPGIVLYKNSSSRASRLYYDANADTTFIDAYNSSGTAGGGTLNLRGNPVKINGDTIRSPIVYFVSGKIADGASMTGYGQATITLYGKYARIEYSYKITSAPTASGDNSAWGVNATLLKGLSSSIPTITPINGGYRHTVKSTGAIGIGSDGTGLDGYAGTHVARSNYWEPSRIYQTAGTNGGWASYQFSAGTIVSGICYGTY